MSDIMAVKTMRPHGVDSIEGRTRAFVQVQNGCDHRCTFCIIPFGRGNSRSLLMDDVIAQARRLVANGYREIVLTGVDITSYGADLTDTPRLGTLVKRILKEVPELARLRLSSIDSVEVDPTLLDALGEEPRLMPHLHLSLQAGDDLVLKRMKRRHSRGDAIAFCDQVRRLRPDVVLAPTSSPVFRPKTKKCLLALSTSSMRAGWCNSMCSRFRCVPARRPRACRRSIAPSSRTAPAACAKRVMWRYVVISTARLARAAVYSPNRAGWDIQSNSCLCV